ncbi:MAG: PAS domain-containing protein [Gemmatimonadota bacterium]
MDSGSYRTVLRGQTGQRLLGFVLLCAVLLSSVWITNRNTHRLAEANRSVEHTMDVLGSLERTLSALKDVESGQRGFTITGNPEFLEPYDAGMPRVQAELAALKRLTSDNPVQQRRVDSLRVLAERTLDVMAHTVDLRRQDPAVAMAFVATAQGKRSMDAVRAQATRIGDEERRLMDVRTASATAVIRQTDRVAALASIAALVMLALLYLTVLRHARELRAAAMSLAVEKDRLQTTLASIGDAVIATDERGHVTYLNAVAETLTGWTNADAAGVPLTQVFDIVNQDTRLPVENPALRALREGVIVGLANHTILIARDGQERPIDDSAAPIRGAKGAIIGSVLVFRDISERYAAERRAEEHRLQMTQTLESITDGFMRIDAEWHLTHVNSEAARINRVSEADSVGRVLWEVFPDMLGTPLEAGYRRCMSEGMAVEMNHRGVESGRWYSILCYPIREGGLTVLVRDVTEQRLAADAVRGSEEQTRTVLESIADSFVRLDRDWRFVYANPQADRLLGLPTGALIGQVIWEAFPGLAGSPFEAVYRRAMDERIPGALTAWYPEHERWYEVRVSPAPDGIVAYFADVSELQFRAEKIEALHVESERQQRLFDTALSAAIDLIFVVDLEGRYTYANAAMLRVLGRDASQVLGRTSHQLHTNTSVSDALRRQIDEVVSTGQVVRAETDFVGMDGQVRSYEYILSPVLGDDGRPEAVTGTVRDTTDRKASERALRDADRRKDEFLATLAHELRNPLAPIRNGLYILELTGRDPVVQQARAMMERQLTNLVRLVDDLLDVSRVTTGKLTLQPEALDLRDVVDAAVETVQTSIIQAQHTLRIVLPDVPVLLNGDRTRLTQVVANLLSNAARYTPSGGQIVLELSRNGGMAELHVRDTGVGIPADMLEQIFEVFSQVDRSLEKSVGGLGIGLSLVRGLVTLHGGTVTARSEGSGRGSEFVVRLPVRDLAIATVSAPDPAPEAIDVPLASRRILVADDNADSAQSLGQLLTLLGQEVRTVGDGEAAIDVCAEFEPEVVLMDIGMPKLNGYEACRRLRALPGGEHRLLVALTGWGQEADRERSLAAGFDVHLVKPLRPGAVSRLLASLPDARQTTNASDADGIG